MKKALITGITGQDGSYLAELLLSKGYEVHGIIRRSSTFNTSRIDHIYVDPHDPNARLFLHYGDLSDSEQISNIIYNIKPDEVYHLGAQSHVRVSFDVPEYSGNVTALGTTRILEAIRRSGNEVKFYQASSSEMFGASPPPQSEETPFKPRSPYACAKAYAYWMAKNYREGYNLFICNGVLFNHESPRRGEIFVTRKITRGIAGIIAQEDKPIFIGERIKDTRINRQLNKGEALHSLRSYLSIANQGVIKRKNDEGVTNQVNCLNLVTNSVITWNTVYMNAAIEQLKKEGHEIQEKDVQHIWPTRYEHINVYGKYNFDVDEGFNGKELRPLR